MTNQLLRFRLLLLLALLAAASPLAAQGFARVYPVVGGSNVSPQSLFLHPDGSARLAVNNYFANVGQLYWLNTDLQGRLVDFDSKTAGATPGYIARFAMLENGDFYVVQDREGDSTIYVTRRNLDGDTLWTTSLGFLHPARVQQLTLNEVGELFVNGYETVVADTGGVSQPAYLAKWGTDGVLRWQAVADNVYPPNSISILPTADGGCFWGGLYSAFLQGQGTNTKRLSATGEVIFSNSLYLFRAGLNAENQILTHLEVPFYDTIGGVGGPVLNDAYSVLADSNGGVIDSFYWGRFASFQFINTFRKVLAMPDGWVVFKDHNGSAGLISAVKLNQNLEQEWERPLPPVKLSISDAAVLPDGSIYVYGLNPDNIRPILIKIGPDGTVYPHTLTARVFRDSVVNCLPDTNDPPATGWAVAAQKSGDPLTYYGFVTNPNGQCQITNLDTGSYVVTLLPKNYLWQAHCFNVFPIPVAFTDTVPQTKVATFPVRAVFECPLLQVDVGNWGVLRRCFSNTFEINYCNDGAVPATDVTVTLLLDSLLTLDTASVPFVQNGSLVTLMLGYLDPETCGSAWFRATVDCDTELGQTLCVTAHIYPDSICAPSLPNWSGAHIEATAVCDGDSVRFVLENTGNAVSQLLDFVIVDDHVITRQGQFVLSPGGTRTETALADGSTWRLIADQEPGYPLGTQDVSVGVEGCDPQGNGSSLGFLNDYPNYTGDGFEDVLCAMVVGSFDPNDKQGLPLGVGEQHEIYPNQPLEYRIRFQNTGTDTAFSVVLRDTLSPWLDPASVRVGASSHPYTWLLSGDGILTFVFDPIALPDSNVNVSGSIGFVQFTIDQRPNLPIGTVLENRAGIYFDFNEVVLTNTALHTIGGDPLSRVNDLPQTATTAPLHIWPNPATETVWVQAPRTFQIGQVLVVRDVLGRECFRQQVTPGATVSVPRNGLKRGFYTVEWLDGQRVLGVGKAVWE